MTGRQPVAWFQFVFVGTMVRTNRMASAGVSDGT
jgi:hypothetical protein